SAAFFALGTARATGRPAVVLCTSGTAAANFHPAVLEARHSRVPLLVCTADRPPELRDTGAGQTVDQLKLYGDAVRWFCEVGAPEDPGPGRGAAAGAAWRSVAARAVAEADGPPAGPVHLNLAFREPLVPTGEPLVDAPGRPDGRPWTVSLAPARRLPDAAVVDRVVELVRGARCGALVVGWGAAVDPVTVEALAAVTGWPVLADPLSGLRRGPGAISTYDALLRVPAFAAAHVPDLVVRVGAPLTSKAATAWLGPGVPQLLVDPDGDWLDPRHAACERVAADAGALLDGVAARLAAEGHDPGGGWIGSWVAAESAARAAIDALVDSWPEPFEGRIARDVVAALPDGATLLMASSMPVRDVESFAAPRDGLRITANRGVNGIDGFVSTVLGTAAGVASGAGAGGSPVVALVGDLCFLHDANGLLGARDRGLDATFVVVDNDGGGIFSFLPQADAAPEHFETLFGTPHGVDLGALARVHGVPVDEIEKAGDLVPALDAAIRAGGVRAVLVRTDRAANVTRHREVWSAVAAAIT
ncbi:MAG TPA: 2-succinyl-5-enolpyruvyl-6-hydroxy-3-cyclohexene-1-carboxylic-acid synthase, partial [Acidimicrobiia bacterium]|nr:2-succinyl-5-enolpyruvyl-6-hydroxy-3-cyclohexene-1-carboxylic-acid synthase [Acidimicrobiia bacterium]